METGASPSQDGGMEGRREEAETLELASRGRWTMGVKFLKRFLVKKQINPINQPIRVSDWFTATSCVRWRIFPPTTGALFFFS